MQVTTRELTFYVRQVVPQAVTEVVVVTVAVVVCGGEWVVGTVRVDPRLPLTPPGTSEVCLRVDVRRGSSSVTQRSIMNPDKSLIQEKPEIP